MTPPNPNPDAVSRRTLHAEAASRLWSHVIRTLAAVLVLLSTAITARGHDAFEIWTIAVLRPDHLEIGITMANSTAMRLITPRNGNVALSESNFARYRDRLEKEAPQLCVLSRGGKPFSARSITVELTDENDVVFKLIFARPPAGPLHFRAACLKKLGQGYGGILDASDSAGKHLGWEQLSFENPTFEITIPAPISSPK